MNRDDPQEPALLLQRLAGELQLLAGEPGLFYPQLLYLMKQHLGASAGVVFLISGQTLTPLADHGFLETIRRPEHESLRLRNMQVLQDVFVSAELRWLPDLFRRADGIAGWDHALLLPVRQGIVELVFPEPPRPGLMAERTWRELSRLAALPFLPPELPQPAAPVLPAEPQPEGEEEFPQAVLALTRTLQRSLRVRDVAGVAVNELARLLPADRVTVLILRGRQLIPLESSGLEKIHSRANLVQSLRKLVHAVLPSREAFAWPDQSEALPPSQEMLLADFVQQAQSARFLILPLFQPAPLLLPEDTGETPPLREPEPVLRGALVVETGRVRQPAPDWQARAEMLARQVEGPLCNAELHQKLPLRFFWTFLGELQDWLQGRRLLKLGLLMAALLLVGGLLCVCPWTYHVSGSGELLPVRQQYVFAPFDGEVLRVETDTGDLVQAGQPVITLRNDALETEWVELTSQKQLKLAQVETLQVRREQVRRSGTREELTQIQGEIEAASIEVRGLTEQLAILEQRRGESVVAAPQAGIVTTFQPRQLLQNRAVSRGEILLEVMDDSQGWRLELTIEEGRLGHLLEAIEQSGDEPLPVEFFLATEPETTYQGTLHLLAVRPQSSAGESSELEVFVQIPNDQAFHRRIGAAVKARIDCGEKPLGYVLFGDFIEFLQRRFWL